MESQQIPVSNPRLILTATGLTAGTLTLKNSSSGVVYGPSAGTPGTVSGSLYWDTGLGTGTYSASGTLTIAGAVYTNAFAGFSLMVTSAVPTLLSRLPTPPAPIYAFQPSGAMIRDEMRRMLQTMLGEIPGSPGSMEPATIDKLLTTSADTLARETYCHYRQFTLPIVPSQAVYCTPPLFMIAGAFATDPDGNLYQLRETASRDLDRLCQSANSFYYGFRWIDGAFDYSGVSWRTADPGSPAFYVWNGLADITLAPAPLFTPSADLTNTSTGTLTVEGWATTEGLWDNPTDFCPLPARSHMTVIDGAILLRAASFPGTINVPMVQARYQRGADSLEREAATYARRRGT